MTIKNQVTIGLSVIALTFAAGRYSVPSPSSKTTETIDVKEGTKTKQDTHKVTTIIKDKDGKDITTIVEDTHTDTKTSLDSKTKLDQTIASKRSVLNVSALVGNDFRETFKPAYGVSVSKEFIGPVTLGAFGLTNGVVGLSIGINF